MLEILNFFTYTTMTTMMMMTTIAARSKTPIIIPAMTPTGKLETLAVGCVCVCGGGGGGGKGGIYR